ncbi:hypothetical protein DVU_1706 [Nitratidesulfovibrio vulgaris str. Hildenborough]|uniref:Uncharacterized protein n=1 Tax=Nitratidesulfovibrio vulgaris (strain ATCC 29579 / DSM 644 / CCUG 34227 / NCIMB 8303 / VKM B-1760 / Hildenborough) TaxID=882 RepID=Q72BD0_NITV2|nr:hypothetical protein DVU_1706 [Nitratidesulfovibrio vulgaris str. Hildenborough]
MNTQTIPMGFGFYVATTLLRVILGGLDAKDGSIRTK